MNRKIRKHLPVNLDTRLVHSVYKTAVRYLVHPGCRIDPCDPQAIASVIRKLVGDPELRRKMGQAGKQSVDLKYSWQHEEPILLQAYQRLLHE